MTFRPAYRECPRAALRLYGREPRARKVLVLTGRDVFAHNGPGAVNAGPVTHEQDRGPS